MSDLHEEIKIKCENVVYGVSKLLGDMGPLFKRHAFVAGGAIRSMILYENVKDFDIFLTSDFLIDQIRMINQGVKYISKNAVTLTLDGQTVQIITNETNTPLKVISEFDFTMNQNYYFPLTQELFITSEKDIIQRQLVVNRTCRNKLGTMARIAKFVNRGYKCPDKLNLLRLGADLTAMNEMESFEDIREDSKLYFSAGEYEAIRDREYWEIKQEEIDAAKESRKIDTSHYRGSAL